MLHAPETELLEKVYENALVHELRKSGLAVSQQHPTVVRYDRIVVGENAVDLLVKRIVLVESKVAKAIGDTRAIGLPPICRPAWDADLLVEHTVIVELKVAKAIDDIHRAQCLNYLKASGLDLCLLLNFGKPKSL